MFGNPNSNIAIAFVYTWKTYKAPKEIHDLFTKVSNYAYVTGYWRTTNGGKYALLNILSNPNVNKLLVFVMDAKDNGHLLVDSLVKLWTKGVNENGIIIDCLSPNPKFEGVPNGALDVITKQCDLIVLNKITNLDTVEELVKAQIQEPKNAVPVSKFTNLQFYSKLHTKQLMYDDGCRFNKPYIVDLAYGTNKVTYDKGKSDNSQTILVNDLDEAISQVSAFIYEFGDMVKDQRDIRTCEYRSFSLTVKDALAKVPSNYTKEYLSKYVDEFLHGKGEGLEDFEYTYHYRIFKKWGNQVDRAISELKNNSNCRRALVSLWDPATDMESSSPPCFNLIWFCIRDNKLELHVVYRSHHLTTITSKGLLVAGEGAMVPNLYAIATLQEKAAKELNVKRGYLHLTDFSGHLYVTEE